MTSDNITQSDAQPDQQLTLNLAIILEYANADIRTAGVQVAFSLVAGLFFTLIGVLLLAAGFTGSLDLTGRIRESGFRLVTTTPGLVAILIGGCIILVGVYKDVSHPLDASVKRPLGMSISAGSITPSIASEGLPPVEGQKEPH